VLFDLLEETLKLTNAVTNASIPKVNDASKD
jgi:hypothetical protein